MHSSLPLEKKIEIFFEGLKGTAGSLPPPGSLSNEFNALVHRAHTTSIEIFPVVTTMLTTCAVEMWLRGVHSFLISASLTESSPLWAAVTGYYASHYCVRGLAHILGFYQLYRKRVILQIDIDNGKHICHILTKKARDSEHKFYWRVVKQDSNFIKDPLFVVNPEDEDESDAAHRNKANYADHINRFPNFKPLEEQFLKERIKKLSSIQLSSVPIPNREKFPDIDSVQLIALHRIIKFRRVINDVLGGSNRFWNVHRNPSWCMGYLDFQVTPPRFVEAGDER
jgi:hypothetical protein